MVIGVPNPTTGVIYTSWGGERYKPVVMVIGVPNPIVYYIQWGWCMIGAGSHGYQGIQSNCVVHIVGVVHDRASSHGHWGTQPNCVVHMVLKNVRRLVVMVIRDVLLDRVLHTVDGE